MKTLHIAQDCPSAKRETEYEMRLDEAERARDQGRPRAAMEWRALAARARREGWGDQPTKALEGVFFWHTTGPSQTEVCPCGHWADYLCDEPIGRGRTCDKPACACCRSQVGDFDQCDYHAKTQPRVPA